MRRHVLLVLLLLPALVVAACGSGTAPGEAAGTGGFTGWFEYSSRE